MNTAFHASALFRANKNRVTPLIRDWLSQNGFALETPLDFVPIVAKKPSSFPALTDRQTGTTMNIIVEELDEICSVSVLHQVSKIFIIGGIIMGNMLAAQVEALTAHIRQGLE